VTSQRSGDGTKQCPNCNGRGTLGEFVEADRNAGRDTNYVGGECDRCNGSGEVTQ